MVSQTASTTNPHPHTETHPPHQTQNPIIGARQALPPLPTLPSIDQSLTVKLGANNYVIWKNQLLNIIIANGLEDFIDVTRPCPYRFIDVHRQVINPDYSAWQRINRLIMSWIYASLTEDMMSQIVVYTTAKEIWDALSQIYSAASSQTETPDQIAADSQTEITHMDADLYKALSKGDKSILETKYSEAHLQLQRTPKGNTVLHIAAQFGREECVGWILDFDSCSFLLQEANLKGDTPLHLAAREGHGAVVKALLNARRAVDSGIESGVGTVEAMLEMTNKEKDTALHEAVRYHHSEVVNSLIEEHPDFIYGANITGYTPLYMAAERGYGDLVGTIIDNTRASPAHSGVMGRTALHAAVIRQDQEMTEKLLEWKPDLTKEVDENGWSPLHCVAYLGYIEIVEKLLDKSDKSVTYLATKDSKKTALHLAANCGHIEIVRRLLSHSPDCCEQVDDQGNNVFHSTLPWYSDVGSLLNGNSLRGLINEKNAKGDTPLHLLASYQIYDPLFLKDNRVDKMALNNDKLTALDILSRAKIKSGHISREELVKQLEEWKKDVVGPFSWREAINEDTGSSKSEDPEEDKTISILKRKGEAHLIVAALVATVTFAAGFTLPGGYNDKDGMAILTKKAAFKAFVVTDTIAVIFSVSAVFVYFFMLTHNDEDTIVKHALMGFVLTMFGMGAMVVAFMTGVYAVLPLSSGLPIVTCIICCFFLLAFYFVFRQFIKVLKQY